MQPEEGYKEAWRLLKARYGQNYKITTAYVSRVTNGPPIRHKDGQALQKFSVFLTSCKNTLKEIGCLNKVENPDSLQRVIERLPFQLRQRWHDVADDITSNKQREITFEDIARFLESKARALNNPIFGNVTSDLKSKGKDPKNHKPRKGENFGIQGDLPNNSVFYGNKNSPAGPDLAKPTPKCHLCNSDHWLTHCHEFKKQSVDQRLTFVWLVFCLVTLFNPAQRVVTARSPIVIQSTWRSCIQRYQIVTLGTLLQMRTAKATEDRLKSTMAMRIMAT